MTMKRSVMYTSSTVRKASSLSKGFYNCSKNILAILTVLLFATSAFALQSPWEKPLPYKKASIMYKMTGSMPGGGGSNGKMEIYFKEYGDYSVETTDMTSSVMGMTNREHDLTITTPNWEYTVDYANNTATKITNPDKYLIQEFKKLSKANQQKIINIINKRGWGIIESSRATYKKNAKKVLGIMCDKISVTNPEPEMSDEVTTTYNIKGTFLPLIVEFRKGSMVAVDMVATSFKKSAPASKFKIPNIQFEHDIEEDRDNLIDAKETIRRLLGMGKIPKTKVYKKPVQQATQIVLWDQQQFQMSLILLMELIDMPQVTQPQQQTITLMMQKIQMNEMRINDQVKLERLFKSIKLSPDQAQQLQDIRDMGF